MVQHEPFVQIKAPAPPEDDQQETPVQERAIEAAADVNSRRTPKARTTKRGETKDGIEEVLDAAKWQAADNAAKAEAPQDPEALLKWIDDRLANITDPFDLPDVWENECLPKLEGAFPPDVESANGTYRRHEKRLDPG
jgi:hypothetical protein